MMLQGLFMMIPGMMLLVGEYLCVEVAWRCINYNQFYIGIGVSLLIMGLVTCLIGDKHD